MAIKVSKQNVPQPLNAGAEMSMDEVAANDSGAGETPLTVMNNALAPFAAANLFGIEEPKEQGNLLPQVKIPCAIEMGDVFLPVHINHVGLYDGAKFQPIPGPYIMTVIAAREATRKLETKLVNGKPEKGYVRAYKSMGPGFDASQAVYESHLTDPEAQRGISYIVGIIDAAGSVSLAEMPTFKVQKDYWAKPLYQAKIQNGVGLRVKIDDHSPNIVASKNGTTKYLAPNKFNQHEIVDLTPQMVQSLSAVWETVKDKFEAWTKQ